MSTIHGLSCNAVTLPRKCSFCGKQIFLFVCDHGSAVLFERLGPPWPKHNCHGGQGNSWRDGDSIELTHNPPSTSEEQSSPSAEVKLDDKMLTTFLSNAEVFNTLETYSRRGRYACYVWHQRCRALGSGREGTRQGRYLTW